MLELILMWMPMQGINFRDFMSVVCTSYSGVAIQLVQSWTNARERIVLRLHLRQCQSGSNVVMVICDCIKSQLPYFIVGQRKECTYVYFHILYRFQLCFKTLYKHFKNKIKILYCAWVPEAFLACTGNFRCWPKADTSSVVGRSRQKNLALLGYTFTCWTQKVWKQGWKGQEKYLANNISQSTASIS